MIKSGERRKLKETEIYPHVKAWLESKGCRVQAEVKNIDVVGLYPFQGEDHLLVAVEMKLGSGLDIILQGHSRMKCADAVYIAIPSNTRYKRIQLLCRSIGIGILLVDYAALCRQLPADSKWVKEIVPPKLAGAEVCDVCWENTKSEKETDFADFPKVRKNKQKDKILKEFLGRSMDANTGGSTKIPIVTAYREAAIALLEIMYEFEDYTASTKQIAEKGFKDAYRYFRGNPYRWFERLDRGVYRLTEEGVEARKIYLHQEKPE